MVNQKDKVLQSESRNQQRKEGAVESLFSGVVKGHDEYDVINTYDKKKGNTGNSLYATNMTNKYRTNQSNMTIRTKGKGWKMAKWNPDENFPLNGFW